MDLVPRIHSWEARQNLGSRPLESGEDLRELVVFATRTWHETMKYLIAVFARLSRMADQLTTTFRLMLRTKNRHSLDFVIVWRIVCIPWFHQLVLGFRCVLIEELEFGVGHKRVFGSICSRYCCQPYVGSFWLCVKGCLPSCQILYMFYIYIYIDVFAFLVWFGYDYLMIHDRFDMCFVSLCFLRNDRTP